MHHEQNSSTTWKILTVDNTPSSNKIIELLAKNLSFQNRNLSVFTASSLEEAGDMLTYYAGIALVLVDIMMEGKESGLKFINFIRNDLKNSEVRIILRTGYPDSLPEKQVIQNYEIDGYIPKEIKSELQIEVSIITALRNYSQITTTKKLMQSLAGSLSHELRTPFASVRGCLSAIKINLDAGLAKKKTEEDFVPISMADFKESLEFMETCNNVIDQGNMIVDLTLEKIYDRPIDKRRFTIVSMFETVNQAINQYPFKESEKEKVTVKITKDDDFNFFGNKDIMIFILFNLLKNSLYYFKRKDEDNITISISKTKDWNNLHFKDNGPGISQEKLETLFENFMTSGKKGGTGLGLPFCKRNIESFDGKIECLSKVGEGTEFVMSFPFVR